MMTSLWSVRNTSKCGVVHFPSAWRQSRGLLFVVNHIYLQPKATPSPRHSIPFYYIYLLTMAIISLLDRRFTKLGDIARIFSSKDPHATCLHILRSPFSQDSTRIDPVEEINLQLHETIHAAMLICVLRKSEVESEPPESASRTTRWFFLAVEDLEVLITVDGSSFGLGCSDEMELAALSLEDLCARLDAQIFVLPESPCTSFVVRHFLCLLDRYQIRNLFLGW